MRHPTSRSILSVVLLALVAALRPAPAPAFTPQEAKTPMTVTLVRSDAQDCDADCPEWIAMTGVIGPDTPALLSAALARMGPRRLPVLVDSPGGRVEAALAMGKAIRARKLDVAVAGTALTDCAAADKACATRRRAGERPGFVAGGIAACASSCVLLLAAGTERSVGENSYVGVHQMTVHKTFTRVMNTFRITRRLVGGRIVEVSRTLVASRPVSSKTVLAAAPEQLYSEVDRYLLSMGVGESIMPLMRSAPPSGVHWMTKPELAATRIATDAADARTLVARAAAKASVGAPASAMVPANVTWADGSRSTGTVAWHIDPSLPSGPALVGTFVVSASNLLGSVTIRRVTGIGAEDGFSALVDLESQANGRAWVAQAPRLCGVGVCNTPFTAAASRDTGAGVRDFGVIRPWGDAFLSDLKGRDWLVIDLTSPNMLYGNLALSLTGGGRGIVGVWEHQCCGLAPPTSAPQNAAVPPKPDPAAAPSRAPAPTSVEDVVAFTLNDVGGATPRSGAARLTWTPLSPLATPGERGRTALVGSLEIPGAGLRVSLQAGPAASGDADGIALDMSLVEDPQDFGPASMLAIPPVWGPDGHVALLADGVEPLRYGGGFRAVLSPAEDLAQGSVLVLEMADRSGRHLSVSVPMDGPLRALLQAARKARGAAAG